jgi:hypothetical protein
MAARHDRSPAGPGAVLGSPAAIVGCAASAAAPPAWSLNTELDVRPTRHRLADRVRAHMFLRMLSYYIGWHMKQALAPILFQDNDKPGAGTKRTNPVAAAQRSDTALAKAARKHTTDNVSVHSFTTLLADLATICANQIQPANDMPAFTMLTTPTPLQRRAFELLGVTHRLGM